MTRPHCKDAFHQRVNGLAFGRRAVVVGLVTVGVTWTIVCISGCVPSAHAQSKPNEYQVKAAYLYNFGRFIEWPTSATAAKGDPFTICVLGQDPFGPALNTALADEAINGQNVVARRIPSPQDAVNCRILFISASEGDRLKQILAILGDASVLTVSDLPQFTQRGGMVQLVLDGNKVRFEVNLTPVERAHLAMSSQLLKVAVNLRRSDRLGD
jgi:hypothetical protein